MKVINAILTSHHRDEIEMRWVCPIDAKIKFVTGCSESMFNKNSKKYEHIQTDEEDTPLYKVIDNE
jgi:hypothetical protein